MKYDKPEVAVIGAAVEVVHGPGKDDALIDNPQQGTVAAYGADE
jgi:hypothetical protein